MTLDLRVIFPSRGVIVPFVHTAANDAPVDSLAALLLSNYDSMDEQESDMKTCGTPLST